MKRCSLSTCALAFLLGWIAGSIFIFCVIHFQEDLTYPADFQKYLNKNGSKIQFLRGSGAKKNEQNQYLYKEILNATDVSQSSPYIFLSWSLSVREFTVHNYNCLESVLAAFPMAKVRILQLHTGAISEHDQVPLHFKAHHFDAYKQLGYDVKLSIVDLAFQSEHYGRVNSMYREKWLQSHMLNIFFSATHRRKAHLLKKNGTVTEGRVVAPVQKSIFPYHLLTYMHLLHLHEMGGIFSDFSFFFQRSFEIESVEQGVFIHSYCSYQSKAGAQTRIYYPKLYDSWRDLTCFTSTMIVFSKSSHPVVDCMLEKYESDSIFLICIESDFYYQGAVCIKEAFQQCFTRMNYKNGLDFFSKDSDSKAPLLQDMLTSLRSELLLQDGPPKIVLKSFDRDPLLAFHSLVKVDQNEVATSNLHSNSTNQKQKSTPVFVTKEEVEEDSPVWWLGHLAWQREWEYFPYSTNSMIGRAYGLVTIRLYSSQHLGLNQKLQQNNLCYAVQSHTNLDSNVKQFLTSSKLFTCLTDSGNKNDPIVASAEQDHHDLENLIVELLPKYLPNPNKPNENTFHTCVPHVFVIGFQHGCTYYNTLMQTALDEVFQKLPNVLLSSSRQKDFEAQYGTYNNKSSSSSDMNRKEIEVGCYDTSLDFVSGDSLISSRAECSPYVPQSMMKATNPSSNLVPFYFVDNSISYEHNLLTPLIMKQDNADANAVFILQNPIVLLYRFYYFHSLTLLDQKREGNLATFEFQDHVMKSLFPNMSGSASIPQLCSLYDCLSKQAYPFISDLYLLSPIASPSSPISELRQMISNGTSFAKLIAYYFSIPDSVEYKQSPLLYSWYMQVCYYPVLLYYQLVFHSMTDTVTEQKNEISAGFVHMVSEDDLVKVLQLVAENDEVRETMRQFSPSLSSSQRNPPMEVNANTTDEGYLEDSDFMHILRFIGFDTTNLVHDKTENTKPSTAINSSKTTTNEHQKYFLENELNPWKYPSDAHFSPANSSTLRLSKEAILKLMNFFEPFYEKVSTLNEIACQKLAENSIARDDDINDDPTNQLKKELFASLNQTVHRWKSIDYFIGEKLIVDTTEDVQTNGTATLRTLWFEKSLAQTKLSGDAASSLSLMHHLLPQRNAHEDTGFNTTLGMLNTF